MNGFVKVCPVCKSPNIKQKIPQQVDSWFCLTCGHMNFMPIEVKKKV
ncbi:MAG: hypothetical protein HOE11_01640 [Candidatus Diapherotrites archaeon]|nr:hypothetical protein [Candidatus Diapherotrites archaeon]MBT4597023.1 hypothetical protein [Candidatus Diapherotrites archaeon]